MVLFFFLRQRLDRYGLSKINSLVLNKLVPRFLINVIFRWGPLIAYWWYFTHTFPMIHVAQNPHYFQMAALDKDNRRDTVFDKVFKGALKEFHASLITYQSVSSQVLYSTLSSTSNKIFPSTNRLFQYALIVTLSIWCLLGAGRHFLYEYCFVH